MATRKTAKPAAALNKKTVKPKPAQGVKAGARKLPDHEQVMAYMKALKHPLKAEMEAVRNIIRAANGKIAERIKWNAPSYYYKEDMVTFNGWAKDNVHLVFHHPAIEKIASPLLQGNYKGRRMAYFNDMGEVTAAKKELQRILNELIRFIDNK